MKNLILSSIIMLCVFGTVMAQTMQVVPQGFNFQAQVRGADGKISANENVELRIGLYQGQFASEADYTEKQSLTTNNFGLINTVVGNGQSNDLITDIDFTSAQYWIKVELKENESFKVIHFAALWSVPYAMAAGNVQESPAGSIVAFGGDLNSIPNGWLPCDGREIYREEYPRLFEAIKTNWGHGDASTTFNIPDLRGVFIRGVDAGAGKDIDAVNRMSSKEGGNTGDNVGSFQSDTIKAHFHDSGWGEMSSARYGNYDTSRNNLGSGDTDWDNYKHKTSTEGGHETRPKNSAVWYIIKY